MVELYINNRKNLFRTEVKRRCNMAKIIDTSAFKKEQLSIASFVAVASDNLIYVADLYTHKLMFLSEAAKKLFKITTDDQWYGELCSVFFDYEDGFLDGVKDNLGKDEFTIRLEYIEEFDMYLDVSDKIITIDGQSVHLSMAKNITKRMMLENSLKQQLEEQQALNACIEMLHMQGITVNQSIDQLLIIIGDYYKSERAYLFKLYPVENILTNTNEWCAEGVKPQIDGLQEICADILSEWYCDYNSEGVFFVDHADFTSTKAKENKVFLEQQDIHSLMTFPLRDIFGDIVGFIGVDNPTNHLNSTYVLSAVTRFVADFIEKGELIAKLNKKSFTDGLTAVHNRNSYEATLQRISAEKMDNIGVAYVDINGLKAINDTHGHERGDKIILLCADILSNLCGEGVYRIGGDEFIVFFENISESDFKVKMEQIAWKIGLESELFASIGHLWQGEYENVYAQIKEADKLMYEAKQEFYQGKNNRRTGRRSDDQ